MLKPGVRKKGEAELLPRWLADLVVFLTSFPCALVSRFAGATSIRDVIAFPLLRAENSDGAAAAAAAAAAKAGSGDQAAKP